MEKELKINGNVAFQEDGHKYFNLSDPTIKYTSVTTLIGKYENEFDKEWVSKYKALERLVPSDEWKKEKGSIWKNHKIPNEYLEVKGITEEELNKTQQDILDEWAAINKEACERGTKIHAELENSFYAGGNNVSLQKFGIGGKFTCKKDYNELNLEYGVYPEYLIYYDNPKIGLHIAGQIDLLIKDGNDIIIGDWKGLPLDTKIPTIEGWSTIKELKKGDYIFDKDGYPTKIINKSDIHYNPCYKITFDNGKSITADHEHRWLISFKKNKSKKRPDGYEHVVMTTEEIYCYLENLEERRSDLIPKILNPKPLECPEEELPIDPYVLGVWLGDGSKACGLVTQAKGSPVWEEIKRRGYELGENSQHNPDRENVEMRTIYGLRTELVNLNLLNNKHIPDIYQRASFQQRLDLLRGFMDTDGYFHAKRKRFVMATGQEWQKDCMITLLATFGIKTTVFEYYTKYNDDGKKFKVWDVCFSTDLFNPFLTRNQDIIQVGNQNNRTFRNIEKVEIVETVPTQCLEVDSPSHTFLCTEEMIVTHNTNKKLDFKGFYNSSTRSTTKMKYPLTDLDDVNFNHYQLQLSTYAWIIKKLNPDFNIKRLFICHFDHKGNQNIYEVQYLKDDVEKMLKHFAKQQKLEAQKKKYERVIY